MNKAEEWSATIYICLFFVTKTCLSQTVSIMEGDNFLLCRGRFHGNCQNGTGRFSTAIKAAGQHTAKERVLSDATTMPGHVATGTTW